MKLKELMDITKGDMIALSDSTGEVMFDTTGCRSDYADNFADFNVRNISPDLVTADGTGSKEVKPVLKCYLDSPVLLL